MVKSPSAALVKGVKDESARPPKLVKVAKRDKRARQRLKTAPSPWSAAGVNDAPPPGANEIRAQEHLLAALAALQSVAVEGSEIRRQRAEETAAVLQVALAQLGRETEGPPIDPQHAHGFAKMLRSRRKAAGLSQQQVSSRVGLCRGTIRNLEAGRHSPSRETLLRLLSLPELGLRVKDVAAKASSVNGWKLNSWLAPRYDPVAMSSDMVRLLNSPAGAALEQTHLYLDPQSAEDWLSLSNSEKYVAAFRNVSPLDQIAARIWRSAGSVGLDVIALGVGDGKTEVRLVRHLVDELPAGVGRISLNLLDISNALLSEAQRHAQAILEDSVDVVTSHANLHDMSRYTGLHSSARGDGRKSIYTLLGYTMANLDNEVRFFADLSGCAQSGDLCTLDFQLAFAPVERPAEILQKDPVLAAPLPPKHVEWMAGPIRRHTVGVESVRCETRLNIHCPVAGSYEVLCFMLASMRDGQQRRLQMGRVRRYEPAGLSQCLAELGWETVATLKYGPGNEKSAAVMLLRRK